MGCTEDVRTKLTADDHAFLTAVALGCDEEISAIVRRLIVQFLARKRHEYSVAARFATAKGIAGKRAGTVREPE